MSLALALGGWVEMGRGDGAWRWGVERDGSFSFLFVLVLVLVLVRRSFLFSFSFVSSVIGLVNVVRACSSTPHGVRRERASKGERLHGKASSREPRTRKNNRDAGR
jgi:hypothetical protein